MKKASLILIFIVPSVLAAQETRLTFEYSGYSGDYLGMALPDTVPQKFAPGYISIADEYDQCLAFSPDGNHMVYIRADAAWQQHGMVYLRRTGDKWLKKNMLTYKGSEKVAFNPSFSGDSKGIIFTMVSAAWPDTDIYYLPLSDSGYSSVPIRMDTPVNTSMTDFGYFLDQDSTVYFTGKRDDFAGGTFDVYTCRKENGRYVTKNLAALNSALDDAAPYVSPDGTYLVYEKMVNDRNLAYNDSTARIIRIGLFVSFRDKNNNWSKPINLGPPVNSKTHRTYRPVISPDGKFLFYTQSSEHGADIYWVSTEVIERLRKK